jgi:hypothetical protein
MPHLIKLRTLYLLKFRKRKKKKKKRSNFIKHHASVVS